MIMPKLSSFFEKSLHTRKIFSILAFFILISLCTNVYADVSSSQTGSAGYGYFKVISSPASGEVIFDGQSYGNTPALIRVSTDAVPLHEVVVKMNGYEDFTQQISYNPQSGETIPISLDASHTMDNIIEFLGSQ